MRRVRVQRGGVELLQAQGYGGEAESRVSSENVAPPASSIIRR
jgi:hypothetical protein